jgi:hypothetical protein
VRSPSQSLYSKLSSSTFLQQQLGEECASRLVSTDGVGADRDHSAMMKVNCGLGKDYDFSTTYVCDQVVVLIMRFSLGSY